MEKIMNSEKLKDNTYYSVLKGIITAIILTLFLFMILGICLANTNLSEEIIKPAIIIISGISILVGTSIGTKNQEKNGIIRGGAIGFLYIFILYFISSILLNDFSMNIYSIIMFLTSFLCGAIGGIIGVNMK